MRRGLSWVLGVCGLTAGASLAACVSDLPSTPVEAGADASPTSDAGGGADAPPDQTNDVSADVQPADPCAGDAGAGAFVRARQLDVGNSSAIAVDGAGNSFIVGRWQTGEVFGDKPDAGGADAGANQGGGDMYVLKRTPQGAVAWVRSFGGAAFDSLDSVAVDGKGDVYVAGMSQSSIQIGPTAFTTNNSIGVVAKLDTNGAIVWATPLLASAPSTSRACSRVVARGATVVAVCSWTGAVPVSVDLTQGGSTMLDPSTDSPAMAIVSIDPANGKAKWATMASTGSGMFLTDAAAIYTGANAVEHVAMTGRFVIGPLHVGGVQIVSKGSLTNGYVIDLLATTGTVSWTRAIGDPQSTQGSAVYGTSATGDGQGGLLVGGSFSGALELGGGLVAAPNGPAMYLADYRNMAGPPASQRAIGGATYPGDGIVSLRTDACGHPVMLASLRSQNLVVDGVSFPAIQGTSAFAVAKLDAKAQVIWAHGVAPPANADYAAFGLAVSPSSDTHVVGLFRGANVDFGDGMSLVPSSQDSFELVYGP